MKLKQKVKDAFQWFNTLDSVQKTYVGIITVIGFLLSVILTSILT